MSRITLHNCNVYFIGSGANDFAQLFASDDSPLVHASPVRAPSPPAAAAEGAPHSPSPPPAPPSSSSLADILAPLYPADPVALPSDGPATRTRSASGASLGTPARKKRVMLDDDSSSSSDADVVDKEGNLHGFVVPDDPAPADSDDDDDASSQVSDVSDDDEFDEAAWQAGGDVDGAREKLRLGSVDKRQAFEWFIEYVVRSALSKEWQEEADANKDDKRFAHFFCEPATQAWNNYADVCKLAASDAWGVAVPPELWSLSHPPNVRSALEAYTTLDVAPSPSSTGRCGACNRERSVQSVITFRGPAADLSDYEAGSDSIADLHRLLIDFAPERRPATFRVGPECCKRIQAYQRCNRFLIFVLDLLRTYVPMRPGADPSPILTEAFYKHCWGESERALNACRAYATEGKCTRKAASRYGRPIDSIPGEPTSDDDDDE